MTDIIQVSSTLGTRSRKELAERGEEESEIDIIQLP